MTEKQLIANQSNAKLGGVKTEEGKEKVRLNAVKHGLLSKSLSTRKAKPNYCRWKKASLKILSLKADLKPF